MPITFRTQIPNLPPSFQRKLLPESEYFVGEVLPPHLSPFVDASSRRIGDYIPPEEKKMLGLEDEAAAAEKRARAKEEEEEEEEEESDEEDDDDDEESEASEEEVEKAEEVLIVNLPTGLFIRSAYRLG